MPRTQLPIADGYYETDSLPVSAQSCINMYPVIEFDAQDDAGGSALVPETLRTIPGVTLILADPDVPFFDPLGPPDVDSPADPDGPTPPDPDARPEIPDAPLPDLDEDSGAPPDGGEPVDPPLDPSDPACIPYSCDALLDPFPGLERFLYTSGTPDLTGWLPFDSGVVVFDHRSTDTENTDPNGTDDITSLTQVSGSVIAISTLSDDGVFNGRIPDLCEDYTHIFIHTGFRDSVGWAFEQTITKVNKTAILGPGQSSDLIMASQNSRGTKLIQFRGKLDYSRKQISTGAITDVSENASIHVSAGNNPIGGPFTGLEIRIWSQVGSFTLNQSLGVISLDEGFFKNEFSFWRVSLNVTNNVEPFDTGRRGVRVEAFVEIRSWSNADSAYKTSSVSGSLIAGPIFSQADGFLEWEDDPQYVPDRIGWLGAGTYSIFAAQTHPNDDFPSMDELFLAWERSFETYEVPEGCP